MLEKHQKGKRKSGHRLVLKNQGSSFIIPRRGVGPSLLPTVDTGLNARDTIEGGSNVETEHGAAIGERRGGVVVNDVSDFFTCLWAVDDPVVSVEWWLGAVWGELKCQDVKGRDWTDLKRDGKSHPANINKRAFGDN